MIDLRSDTVTRPSAAMRRAMAEAEVGDEQLREDPTVLALERRAAALLGQEEALFLPTATMANQIALKLLTQPGEEVLGEAQSHVFRYEVGGPAFHSGLVTRPIVGRRGLFGPGDVLPLVNDPDFLHLAPTRLLCVENTSNAGGGTVWPLPLVREVCSAARAAGLSLHLDGSRLLNAAVASGIPAADYGREFDTVTLCLSKGLGCPLGAVLAGPGALMARGRRYKHLFGGAMRQAGIVAAAGLYALDHNVERLADDHANARRLADGLAAAGLPVVPADVETNFVLLDASALGLGVEECAARLGEHGVLLSAAARAGHLRAVTHLDVSADEIDAAITAAATALATAGLAR
ncbi:MAG: GntG family PLP-dependent aldolase [Gaiellales bacterium]